VTAILLPLPDHRSDSEPITATTETTCKRSGTARNERPSLAETGTIPAVVYRQLTAEVARDPDYELLDLLPTHRSQITYSHSGRRYVLHPDASFQLGHQGDWNCWLVEYERRAVTPKRVPERLRGYRRYFASDYPRRDHGGAEPLVLFLFESAEAEATFLDTAARLRHAPFASSNLPTLTERGVLGTNPGAWRLPPTHPAERVPLHAVRSVRTGRGQVPKCNCTRPERFL